MIEACSQAPSSQPTLTQLLTQPTVLEEKRTLMPHQEQAVQWLLRTEAKWRAALLCDDMGLGKTATVLTHTLRSIRFPVAIFAPSGIVVSNWAAEIGLCVTGAVKMRKYESVTAVREGEAKIWKLLHYVLFTYKSVSTERSWDMVRLPLFNGSAPTQTICVAYATMHLSNTCFSS